jgi:adenylyltransferase/sulfurtransferase
MQAIEAMKVILRLPALIGRLLVWDALSMRSRTVSLTRQADCAACSIPRDSICLSDLPTHCEISESFREISANELQFLLSQEKLQLIDVREPHEWISGCLPGARGLPLSEIMTKLDAELKLRELLPLDSSRLTVFYCQSGTRSRLAIEAILRSDARFAGKLSHLKGGLALWPSENRKFMRQAPEGHSVC